jgi:hypothetical protein
VFFAKAGTAIAASSIAMTESTAVIRFLNPPSLDSSIPQMD